MVAKRVLPSQVTTCLWKVATHILQMRKVNFKAQIPLRLDCV